jgi:hypothetical protein
VGLRNEGKALIGHRPSVEERYEVAVIILKHKDWRWLIRFGIREINVNVASHRRSSTALESGRYYHEV